MNEYRNQIDHSIIDIKALKLRLLGICPSDSHEFDLISDVASYIETIYPEILEGKIWPKLGETMIGYKRLCNIEACLTNIINNKVEGDLIETGVWRGGACIFMRALLEDKGISDKKVWVADSFEGLPIPNSILYPDDSGDISYTFNELSVSLDEVKNNFANYHFLDDQVVFLKGWFKDTLPAAPIGKLSMLRLDGDLYESTIDALFYLYPKLSPGGYCIIDDWGAIAACRHAVEDYRKIYNITEDIQGIDWTGVFWIKEKESPIYSRDQFNRMILTK